MGNHDSKFSRRDLLKAAGIAGVGLTTSRVSAHAHDDPSDAANDEVEATQSRPSNRQP